MGISLGLGHGLAGVAISLHALCGALGVESEVLPALIEVLRGGLGPNPLLDRELDFCRGRGGIAAVLTRIDSDGPGGFVLPKSASELVQFSCRARSGDFCHGSAAIASAFGFWPESFEVDEDPFLGPTTTGMFCGRSGEAYGSLAWKFGLPNLMWGGAMGEPPR